MIKYTLEQRQELVEILHKALIYDSGYEVRETLGDSAPFVYALKNKDTDEIIYEELKDDVAKQTDAVQDYFMRKSIATLVKRAGLLEL